MPRSLFLAPLSPEAHDAIVRLHERWEVSPPPMMPGEAVVVVNERGVVVASVYLYETTQWLFAEYLVTNEDFPVRMRYMACLLALQGVMASAAAKGLFIMATPRSRGAQRAMARYGFRDSGFPMWVRPRKGVPLWTEAATAPVPSGPKKAPPKRPRRAPPPAEVPCDNDEITAHEMKPVYDEPDRSYHPPDFDAGDRANRGDPSGLVPRRRSRQGRRSGLG